MNTRTKKITTKTSDAAAEQAEGAPDGAQTKGPREGVIHGPVLTAEELAFLLSLGSRVALGETVRVDLAELLMDEETVAALQRYQEFFRYGDVDVGPALEVLPHAVALKRLKQRLDLASALVQRHIATNAKPIVGVVSEVRRMVVGTPEGSAVRDAFATFDANWKEAFPGGGRPAAKGADEAKGSAPAADPKGNAPAADPTK